MKSSLLILVMMVTLPTHGEPFKLLASKKVVVAVMEAFIPSGFDSSAEQMVVVNGYFPNGCYSLDAVSVQHVDEFNHKVSVVANVQQGMCTMAIIPYQKEVMLGVLAKGKHKLIFPSSDDTVLEKSFVVE